MRKVRWRFRTKLGVLIYSLSAISLFTLFTICFFGFTLTNNANKASKNPPMPSSEESLPRKEKPLTATQTDIAKITMASLPTTTMTVKLPRIGGRVWFEQRMDSSAEDVVGGDDQFVAMERRRIDPIVLADLLPHLRRKANRMLRNLNARVLVRAKNFLRSPPELLLMIPSTHRKEHNYLNDTLRNLFDCMSEGEKHLTQIVVMLSENSSDPGAEGKLRQTVREIELNFGKEVGEGLIEVIAPPSKWFPPNLDRIPPTLGDPPERMRWRAKQSLDYAFAMYHTQVERPGARFYVQLEDDVITVPGFLAELHRFANEHSNFFMCEFSNLGFIGRMFHNGEDLRHLAHFILLLYRSLPVDWILSNVINAKFCSLDDKWKDCIKKRLVDIVLFRRNPPLFQHVGKHSSLPGKVQNLTEKHFTRNKPIEPLRAKNPPLGEFHSDLASAERWRAFYEENTPLELNRTELELNSEDGLLVELDFRDKLLAELKGLRVFFAVQFNADLASITFPNTLLRVTIRRNSTSSFIATDYPSPLESSDQRDHFLIIAEPPLKQIQSVQLFLTGGQWRRSVERFTLTALRILT